jgi:hypothetical protein
MLRLPQAVEAAIRQYEIQPRPIPMSWLKRAALFFAVSFFMFGFRWIIDSLMHWERESFVVTLMMPVVFGVVFGWRLPERLARGGSLIIGSDFVEGRTRFNWFTIKRRIARERIKRISENNRGLFIRDRSEFAARMLGFVFVPATMPEYQEIRSALSQWAPVNMKS